MRMAFILCAALLATSLLGCIPAFYPYFTDDSVVPADGYVGTWRTSDGESWTLANTDRGFYRLVENRKDSIGEYKVQFFKVADLLFADISPLKSWDNLELYGMLLVPTHILARIEGSGDTIRLGVFDGDWYTKQVKAGALDLNMVEVDDAACVTAPTQQLQEAIVKYAFDSAAFPMKAMFRQGAAGR